MKPYTWSGSNYMKPVYCRWTNTSADWMQIWHGLRMSWRRNWKWAATKVQTEEDRKVSWVTERFSSWAKTDWCTSINVNLFHRGGIPGAEREACIQRKSKEMFWWRFSQKEKDKKQVCLEWWRSPVKGLIDCSFQKSALHNFSQTWKSYVI